MSALVSLSQVKTHLRFPNPQQPSPEDVSLETFIGAADDVIRAECDDVLPREYSERHDGGQYKIFLFHKPVLAVKNIQEGWGWITYDLDFQDANAPASSTTMFGYGIDNPASGEISRRTVASVPIPFIPGEGNIFVQYVAGRETVPATIQLAAMELVAHFWQSSQLRGATLAGANLSYDSVSGVAYTRDTESGNQNINVGVPFRILELIKGHRRTPIIA